MRALAWIACILCLTPWHMPPRSELPLSERLLGPVSAILGSAEWVRFDGLVREGRFEAAYEIAERALALDPHSPQGWLHLAAHLAYFRASAESGEAPERRRTWVRSALDLLERGETHCTQPGELALAAALVLLQVAHDEETGLGLGWPGGAKGAREEAAHHLERAASLGVARLTPSEILEQ